MFWRLFALVLVLLFWDALYNHDMGTTFFVIILTARTLGMNTIDHWLIHIFQMY